MSDSVMIKWKIYHLKNRRVSIARMPGGDWLLKFKRLEDKEKRIINRAQIRLTDEAMSLIAYHVTYGAVQGEWELPDGSKLRGGKRLRGMKRWDATFRNV